jgi:hypothetical protein
MISQLLGVFKNLVNRENGNSSGLIIFIQNGDLDHILRRVVAFKLKDLETDSGDLDRIYCSSVSGEGGQVLLIFIYPYIPFQR